MNEWTGKAISMPPNQSHAHKNQLQNTSYFRQHNVGGYIIVILYTKITHMQ